MNHFSSDSDVARLVGLRLLLELGAPIHDTAWTKHVRQSDVALDVKVTGTQIHERHQSAERILYRHVRTANRVVILALVEHGIRGAAKFDRRSTLGRADVVRVTKQLRRDLHFGRDARDVVRSTRQLEVAPAIPDSGQDHSIRRRRVQAHDVRAFARAHREKQRRPFTANLRVAGVQRPVLLVVALGGDRCEGPRNKLAAQQRQARIVGALVAIIARHDRTLAGSGLVADVAVCAQIAVRARLAHNGQVLEHAGLRITLGVLRAFVAVVLELGLRQALAQIRIARHLDAQIAFELRLREAVRIRVAIVRRQTFTGAGRANVILRRRIPVVALAAILQLRGLAAQLGVAGIGRARVAVVALQGRTFACADRTSIRCRAYVPVITRRRVVRVDAALGFVARVIGACVAVVAGQRRAFARTRLAAVAGGAGIAVVAHDCRGDW